MSRRIVTLTAASVDFLEAVKYYSEQNVDAAERLVEEYDRTLSAIEAAPLAHPIFVGEARKRILRRFPYSIVYRVLHDEIRIIALAHQSRRPGFWFDRI